MLRMRRKTIIFIAMLLAGAGALLWRWWPRPPLIFDHVNCIEPSPSGRYIALTGADAKNRVGLWLYTVRSQHWRFFPCLANEVQWLPDEQSVILCHRSSAVEPNGDEHERFSFARLSLKNFQEKKYGCLDSDAVEWKVLPDGSEIVATRCVEMNKLFHTELWRCSLADGQWSCVFESPASEEGYAGGTGLCISRYPETISIAFNAGSEGIDQWWVDVPGGKAYACVISDQLFQVSPDGEFYLGTGGILKKPARPHIVFTGVSKHTINLLPPGTLTGKISIPEVDGETSYAWSPSGHMLAMATPTGKDFSPGDPVINTLRKYVADKLSMEVSAPHTDEQYHLLTSSGKVIGQGKGDHPQWVGNDLLLVVFPDNHLQKTVAQSEATFCYHYFLATRKGKIIRELFMANIMAT